MPSIETLGAFFVATALFAYMPGPAMLYAAAQTMARGRKAGWMAALGIHIGGYVHVLAAALGLAALFSAVPILYSALKIGGAAYLIWLGVRLILGKDSAKATTVDVAAKSPRRAFFESITVEALNPKTALFFVAFLPQFTDVNAALPLWAQLLILGTFVNVMFSSADVVCVIAADKLVSFFKKSKTAGGMFQKLGGAVLVGLGLKLAFDPK